MGVNPSLLQSTSQEYLSARQQAEEIMRYGRKPIINPTSKAYLARFKQPARRTSRMPMPTGSYIHPASR
jgi:hypothetical protein